MIEQLLLRQFLVDAYQVELYERLAASTDARLAEIAAKAVEQLIDYYHWPTNNGGRLTDLLARATAPKRTRPHRRPGA